MRAFMLFTLLVFLLSGCGPDRIYENTQALPPTFEFAVIETPYSDIKEQAVQALSPYFTITTRAEVRVAGQQKQTLLVEINGSRGLFGSSAMILLRRFEGTAERPDGKLVHIGQKAGFFWTGFERAMIKALRQLDDEAASMSGKLKSQKQ
jgi:F0F1-type ATP synthase gamma subunit